MHTRRRLSQMVLLASLTASLLVVAASAQTDRGTITGTVTDQSGAVLVGAKVTVVNIATGSSVETNTSGAGLFTVPQLAVQEIHSRQCHRSARANGKSRSCPGGR
jgi:hypothetical protein